MILRFFSVVLAGDYEVVRVIDSSHSQSDLSSPVGYRYRIVVCLKDSGVKSSYSFIVASWNTRKPASFRSMNTNDPFVVEFTRYRLFHIAYILNLAFTIVI